MKRISGPSTQGSHSYLFVIFWLCILASLLAWKGSTFAESFIIRRYLGMTEPSASPLWWMGAGCVSALVIVWLGCMLLSKARPKGGIHSLSYVTKSL